MKLFRTLFAAVFAVGLAATPALAERPRDQANAERSRDQTRDQDRAFEAAKEGRSMLLPNLKRQVMPFMEGYDYLSSERNGEATRLKFMRDGRVIWVDVDGAGRIIRRSKP